MAGAYHVRYQKGSSICYYSTPYNDFAYEIQMRFVKSASQNERDC